MARRKRHPNVSSLIRGTTEDRELHSAFDNRIANRCLVKKLLVLRAANGLSQEDIAKSLDCSQSRVSKIEGSCDDDMRVGDLRGYAKAVGCDFLAGFLPLTMKPVDKVKCHVFAIKKHMDDLGELAKADEKVAEGVAGFFSELFFNFARLFGDSVKRLPLAPDDKPYFDFHMAEICSCRQITEDADPPVDVSDIDENDCVSSAP